MRRHHLPPAVRPDGDVSALEARIDPHVHLGALLAHGLGVRAHVRKVCFCFVRNVCLFVRRRVCVCLSATFIFVLGSCPPARCADLFVRRGACLFGLSAMRAFVLSAMFCFVCLFVRRRVCLFVRKVYSFSPCLREYVP